MRVILSAYSNGFVPIDYSGQLFLNKLCQSVSFKKLVDLIYHFIGMSLYIMCLYYPFNIYMCLSDITCFIPYGFMYLLFSPLIFCGYMSFIDMFNKIGLDLLKNTLCTLCH